MHHIAVNIGQTKAPTLIAIGQSLVVQAQQM